MFGHQDDQHHHHDDDHKTEDVLSGDAAEHLSQDDNQGTVVSDDFNPALPGSDSQFGAAPAQDDAVVAPADDAAPAPVEAPAPAATPGDSELLSIKQQVLTSLSPLVDHLDQTPEEKFRTTMMMIQASDNQDLIKVAYEAANQIADEKVKAQALLDIVNEINYFTQQQNG